MSLTPGARLGLYDIVTAIGAGGMGEVYRARDTRLGREVAIKVLPAGVATDPDRLARFEREARAVAALNHPNIVTLHSIEEAGDTRFITMELVEGSSLDTFVTAGGLPVPQLYDLAVPLADALAAAHARGVVHRDLKPANVMVTRDGRIKVLDFGLARITEAGRPLDATQAATVATPASSPGQVVGTVPYMSPEQLRGGAVDARSDLFSLGIILYELAAGRRPFAGGNLADVSSAILRDAPARLSEQRADLPADLERIIGRCLEKDPERRIQTAKDVRNELDLARAALVPAPAARRTPPPVPRPPSSTGPSGTTSAPGDSPSIAVLPFVNRSGSDEDEYFSDGLADELLGVLAKIKGLRVAARTSSFQFKGKAEDPAEIGRRLKVATLLEGSVRKAGNRVRISVQLVNVADGFHLWSESYDRTLDDIFAVQDDIARSVVQELRAALFGAGPDSRGSGELRAEVAAAGRGRATDPEVHRLCLQGRYLVERGSIPDLEAGIACLRKALDIEPAYAIAWAVLSRAEGRLVALGQGDVTEVNARARESARRAVELDPELVEGYLAIVYHNVWHEWDWAAAAAAVQRARQLAPQNAEVLRAAGLLAYSFGRVEESIDHLSRAADLDPLNAIGFSSLGRSLSAAGRFTEAESVQRTALELSPGAATFRLLLARALEGQGRFDEALAEAVQEPVEWARLTGEAIYCFRLGRTEASDRALHGLLSRHADTAAYQIALVHAVRGEVDLAFDWLDRAYAQRDSGLGVVKPSGYFTTLHGDPRWAALLRRAGLDRE